MPSTRAPAASRPGCAVRTSESTALWIGWPGDVASARSRPARGARAASSPQLRAGRRSTSRRRRSTRYYEASRTACSGRCSTTCSTASRSTRATGTPTRRVNERFADVVARRLPSRATSSGSTTTSCCCCPAHAARAASRRADRLLPPHPVPVVRGVPDPAVARADPRRACSARTWSASTPTRTAALRARRLLRVLGARAASVDRVRVRRARECGSACSRWAIDAAAFARRRPTSPRSLEDARRDRAEARRAKLLLGVDRLDYTKGIPRRLLAFERLLEREPDAARAGALRAGRGAVAREGRRRTESYRAQRRRARRADQRRVRRPSAGRPIHYLYRSSPQRRARRALPRGRRDARHAAARRDEPRREGVRRLARRRRRRARAERVRGRRGGAGEALLVNPYDVDGMADAIQRALDDVREGAHERMRALRRRVLAPRRRIAWARSVPRRAARSRVPNAPTTDAAAAR